MKTTIWASCPKCQTELKIDTNETELVQIECPDCHKVFAAKVPARAAAPMPEVFAPMPSLPAFQPAQVHYTPRKKSDDSLNPAALTALIIVCASAILIPLGFGGYYLYGKLSEQSLLAPPLALNNTTESSATPPANVSDDGLANSSINATPVAINSPNNSAIEVNAQPNISRKMPPPSDPMGESALAAGTPFENSPPQTDSMVFGVPELNPPPLIQQGPTTPQTVPAPNSTPMTSSPVNPGTSSPTWASPDMVNPSMNNPGVVNPGVVNPGVVNPGTVNPGIAKPGINPGMNPGSPMNAGISNPSQPQVSVSGPGTSQSGLPVALHRFVGPSGAMIFVLHAKGHSVGNAIQELQRTLSIPEMHAEGDADYTTIGIRYSGTIDSIVKGIRFGRVSYADEESRSIHVQVN